jgi:hypothetical protein
MVYFGLRFVFSLWASSPYIKATAVALSEIAWVFSGAQLLIGAFAFAVQKIAASKAGESANEPFLGKKRTDWRNVQPLQSLKNTPLGEQVTDSPVGADGSTRIRAFVAKRPFLAGWPHRHSVVPGRFRQSDSSCSMQILGQTISWGQTRAQISE